MPSTLHAVLIADIKGSRSRARLRDVFGKLLARASQRHLRAKSIRLPYSITAGDEFQTVVSRASALPQLLLDLRILFQPLTLRIGIGIGRISDRIQPPVNRLSGEAFQFARLSLNNLKDGRLYKFDSLTAFHSRNAEFNETINLLYGLQDTLVAGITARQWETIATFHAAPALESAARRMKLDISTVSRNLKRGYYWQVAETLKVTESLIARTFR